MNEKSPAHIDNRSTIMICEHDLNLVQLFQQVLASKYNIITVDSGTGCLNRYINEKVTGNQIDVLLVDYRLKDLPGDIVATTIRELSGSKKRVTSTILVSTCDADKELLEELKIKDCIIESLEKPISAESLIKIIERAVA
jgi:response regulator RpfG family c-di-GMP phosphodiesterase